jgi:trk system potassium uptake protein TrkA
MKVVVVGCGRVGSAVAQELSRSGWDVSVVDENEEAFRRLGDRWPGTFVAGHGLETEVLVRAGIEDADAVVVATDGDNTNIVIGQVAQKRYAIDAVVVRVLDPARARWYSERGLHTVSPTSTAIKVLTDSVRAADREPEEAPA